MRVIAGIYRGRIINSLPSNDTRPTKDMVKGAIFSIIQFEVENAIVLDLFAGSGSIGIEAISRGASKVYFNDLSKQATKIIKENLDSLAVENTKYEISNYDYNLCLKQARNDGLKFNFVYLDPPYKLKVTTEIINSIVELNLIKTNGVIMAEVDRKDEVLEIKNFKLKVREYGNTKLLVYRFNPGLSDQ